MTEQFENLSSKKDNHSQQTMESETPLLEKKGNRSRGVIPRDKTADKEPEQFGHSSGSDIQSPKIFEDVIKLIDECSDKFIGIKLYENGFDKLEDYHEAKEYFEDLKSKIKEKWGKI
jgi:hypothetical protein